MVASRADVQVRFQYGACLNRGASGTLHRGRDRRFAPKHDSLLPGIKCKQRAIRRKPTLRLSQVRQASLDENLNTVMIGLGSAVNGMRCLALKHKKTHNLRN